MLCLCSWKAIAKTYPKAMTKKKGRKEIEKQNKKKKTRKKKKPCKILFACVELNYCNPPSSEIKACIN